MKPFQLITTATAIGTLIAGASGADVPVTNGDFEDRTGTQYQDAANWTITGTGNSGGWTAVENNGGIVTTDADGTGSGGTYLFLFGAPTATSGDLTAAAAGTLYTAKIRIAEPKTAYPLRPGNYRMELLIGGVVKSSTSVAPPVIDDTWGSTSVSYYATGADVGQVSIRLSNPTGGQSFYDNLTLDASVPTMLPVAVPNGDFETRTGAQYSVPTDWTTSGGGGGWVGMDLNPNIVSADAGGDSVGTFLFLAGTTVATSADLTAAVDGDTYIATAWIAEPKTPYSQRPGDYLIELLVGGVVKASATAAPPVTDDSWEPLSVGYIATGADAGQQVSIRLSSPTAAQSFYDNVTLSAGLDTTDPALVSLNPADGTPYLVPSANLIATFSEPIKVGTGDITITNLTDMTDTVIPVGDSQVSISGATLTIDPASDLLPNKTYAVLIDASAIDDLSGNSFTGISDDTIWNFGVTDVIVIDNGDPGFTSSGFTLQGSAAPGSFNGDTAFNSAPDNGGIATWTFSGLPSGAYEVFASWNQAGQGNASSVAPYTVSDGGGIVTVDQKAPPAANLLFDDSDGTGTLTHNFELLATVEVTDGELVVDLNAVAGGGTSDYALADAVAIRPNVAPMIVSLSPLDDASNIPIGANLVATFDEHVVVGSGDITIKETIGNATVEVIDVGSVGIVDNVVTINPINDLSPGVEYYVLIDGTALTDSFTDFGGIADPLAWSFTTDNTPPTILVQSPGNGVSGVALGANLVATFDEEIAIGTGDIIIRNLSALTEETIAVGDSQISVLGTVLTINPTSDLLVDQEYAIQIDAGAIVDSSGNPFAGIFDDTTWAFDTIPVTVIDNGDPGYASTGLTQQVGVLNGFNGDQQYNTSPNNGGFGTWTFSGLAAGEYEVFATWIQPGQANTSPVTPFTLSDGGGALTVNQEAPPAGDLLLEDTDGLGTTVFTFEKLATVIVSDGELEVRIDAVAGGGGLDFILADAVAIRLNPTPSAYYNWTTNYSLSGSDAEAATDVEGDSLENLLEFAFGTNPTVSDNDVLEVTSGTTFTPGGPIASVEFSPLNVTFRFVRLVDHVAAGLVYTPEFTADAATFVPSADVPTVVVPDDGSGYEVVEVPFMVFLPDGRKATMTLARVVVTLNP